MAHEQALCWIDDELVPAAQARISVLDHGLLYGDGVFEGIRFYKRRCFRLGAHLQRLHHSARAIGLQLPFTLAQMADHIRATVDAAAFEDGYLRVVVTRGVGSLGLDPRRCCRPGYFVLADTLAMVDQAAREQGARVIIASTRRLALDGLDPRIKSLNYLNHILARMEANLAGADEAILLNQAGRVTEGSADNLFIVRDGELLTPPVIDGALAGITRAVMLELAQQACIPAREQSLAPYDLYTADELFLTGTGAELIPVREVDGRPLPACPGPVFHRLQALYAEAIAANEDV
jgi:branched-chain amino acid aminotransferase